MVRPSSKMPYYHLTQNVLNVHRLPEAVSLPDGTKDKSSGRIAHLQLESWPWAFVRSDGRLQFAVRKCSRQQFEDL